MSNTWHTSLTLATALAMAFQPGCSESPGARRTDAGGPAPDLGPPPQPTCTPENCDGCCSGMICVRGYAQDACGRGGQACSPCKEPLSCVAGECKEGPIEICNGKDDDGDGDEDEGCNNDRDDYCNEGMTVEPDAGSCVAGGGDCDDRRPLVHPGGSEICNGQDDDCDDATDEDDVCSNQGPVSNRPLHLPQILSEMSCVAHVWSQKIYCLGGGGGGIGTDQILKFDPSVNALDVKSAKLPTPRYGLSCAAHADKIYCFGGYWQQNRCVEHAPFGCTGLQGTPTYLHDIFEYDPSTDAVTPKKATLPAGRTRLACAASSATNKIYCFGGAESGPTAKDDILEYDPKEDALNAKKAKLPSVRLAMSCVEDSETQKIYCFGGKDDSMGLNGAKDDIIEYDAENDALTTLSVKLDQPRAFPACAQHSSTHKIYCLGGVKPFESIAEIVELDPGVPSLNVVTPRLSRKQHALACAAHSASHSIFCLGGADTSIFYDDVLEFRP